MSGTPNALPWDPVEAIAAELEDRGWSGRDLAQAAAARFGCSVATAETWWYRLRTGRREDPGWLDRLLVVLDLHEPPASAARPGLDAWCPRCREVVATAADGRCIWCEAQTGGNTVLLPLPGRRANAGVPILASEAVVAEARRLYLQGGSLRTVARELHGRTAYASVRSFASQLCDLFRSRGWATRDRVEATVAASRTHGLARDREHRLALRRARGEIRGVRCAGVRTQYPRKGARCLRPALAGGLYCAQHEPSRAAAVAAALAGARSRRAA